MLSDRLKTAMAKAGISQAALARACGVQPPSVHGWLNNKSKFLRGENLLSAAKTLGVSAKWLADGVGPMTDAEIQSQEDDEFAQVRRADVRFANGHGQIVYSDDDKPPLAFRNDFLKKLGIPPGKALVVESKGNSNYPKIVDGAVVLVNTADKDRLDGGFFAFRVEGELLIKRLETMKDVGILATAENSDFTPKNVLYRDPADFEVLGRAMWSASLL